MWSFTFIEEGTQLGRQVGTQGERVRLCLSGVTESLAYPQMTSSFSTAHDTNTLACLLLESGKTGLPEGNRRRGLALTVS